MPYVRNFQAEWKWKVSMTVKSIYNLFRQALSGEQRDYTNGSIRKAVFLLSIPMILEMCMESVFAVVDIFFVGRIGRDAVATVGLTESVQIGRASCRERVSPYV